MYHNLVTIREFVNAIPNSDIFPNVMCQCEKADISEEKYQKLALSSHIRTARCVENNTKKIYINISHLVLNLVWLKSM